MWKEKKFLNAFSRLGPPFAALPHWPQCLAFSLVITCNHVTLIMTQCHQAVKMRNRHSPSSSPAMHNRGTFPQNCHPNYLRLLANGGITPLRTVRIEIKVSIEGFSPRIGLLLRGNFSLLTVRKLCSLFAGILPLCIVRSSPWGILTRIFAL